MLEASVPSADTVYNYISTVNSIEEILPFFRALNSGFIPRLKIPDTPQDFATDWLVRQPDSHLSHRERHEEGHLVFGTHPFGNTEHVEKIYKAVFY